MNNRTRPCLLYQIGRCAAPCMSEKSETNQIYPTKNEYGKQISLARQILSGNTTGILSELSGNMQSASSKMDFESAAKFRDQISALTNTASVGKYKSRDADFFVFDSGALAIVKMRGGQIISHQIIYPKNIDDLDESEIVALAILEFDANSDVQIITNVPTLIDGKNIITKPNDEYVLTLLSLSLIHI